MPHSVLQYRLLLLALTIFSAAASVQSQCTQKFSELPAAPEFFGFHLGMTKDEVKARVPQTVFGRTDAFGVSKTTINPSFDPKIDQTKFEGVRSISLDMHKDGTQTSLVNKTPSTAIHSGSSPNLLEVRIKGSELSFYANGEFLTKINDPGNYKRGRAGFYTSDVTEVAFDDLQITR